MHEDPTNPEREPAGARAIVRLYRAALGCFPRRYRQEFGEELLYAVRMAAAEAQAHGRRASLRLAWRELRDLPLAVVRAHLHERSLTMDLRPGAHLPGGPLRLWHLGAIFVPLLLLLVFPVNEWAFRLGLPWLLPALLVPFGGLFVVVWIAGARRGFPVWALPALGMALVLFSALLKLFAMMVVFTFVFLPVYGKWGWPHNAPLGQSIANDLLVDAAFVVVVAAVVVTLLWAFPPLRRRVWQEWTLLPFLLYCTAMAHTWLWGDEWTGVEGYQVAGLGVLALGAVLYLVAPRRWQRVLALVVAAVLAPALMSYGMYQAFPIQSWANPANPPYVPLEQAANFRWWESLQPALGFASLPVLLLLAGLAPRLRLGGPAEGETRGPEVAAGS